jgi:hypothetical protein
MHGDFVPLPLSRLSPSGYGNNNVVPIFENIGLNHKRFADDAFCRVTSALNDG